MFGLTSRLLRRRLSAPTSGSARRRARERKQAELTRREGERIARESHEQRAREKRESQRQVRENLASYEPWGRAGGGAPNPRGIRYSNLRAGEIYPEDELKGISQYEACKRWPSPHRRRRRTPIRLREDPQLCYADSLRRSVDNDIRYKQTSDQHNSYKKILDDMVDKRRKAEKAQKKRDLEYERMMQTMDGPWGRPGPGGTTWRNPRNIGHNFSQSMGWTDNEIFNKMKGEEKMLKRSSLTLPQVKRDDDLPDNDNKPSSVGKLPDINNKKVSKNTSVENEKKNGDEPKKDKVPNKNGKRSPKNKKFIKRLTNGERVQRIIPNEENDTKLVKHNVVDNNNNNHALENKLTPEETILRLTGGIELVPLLARRRRFGARTLPSSDVTRPPEQNCEWREIINMDYLKELKHQMRVKCEQKEESRRDSAESVIRHHETWATLWGRPGHGAPQRGRYARNNLARLLHVPPLAAQVL